MGGTGRGSILTLFLSYHHSFHNQRTSRESCCCGDRKMEDGGGSLGGGVGSGGGGPVPFCILPTASTSTNSSLLADISNLTFPSRVKRRSPEQVPVQNKRVIKVFLGFSNFITDISVSIKTKQYFFQARRVEGPGNPKNFLDNTSSSAESGDEIHSQDGQRKPREKVKVHFYICLAQP